MRCSTCIWRIGASQAALHQAPQKGRPVAVEVTGEGERQVLGIEVGRRRIGVIAVDARDAWRRTSADLVQISPTS